MTKVFAWPPVGVVSRDWSIYAPVNTSRSLITGRRYISAHQPRRREVDLSVSGAKNYGAGYMEALKRLIDGGVHLVRLTSCKIPYGRVDTPDADRQTQHVAWIRPAEDVAWTRPAEDVMWVVGSRLDGLTTTIRGLPAVRVDGLPPNSLIGLPGEFLSIGGETHMIAQVARSSSAGRCFVRIVTTPTISEGEVNLGVKETAVFEALSIPRAQRSGNEFGSYDWSFREVFEDETPGGFEEIDPWS